MMDAHDQRWDGLALGHVLGGLGDADATEFRGHLVGCATCRARVAELRSMAADLASAEREERAVQRLRTQTRRDEDSEDDQRREEAPRDPQLPRWRTLGIVAVVGVLLGALGLWNAHLRNQNTEYARVVDVQERTLDVLGGGSVVPADTAAGVTGVVAAEGDRIAYALAGLPTLAAAERLVVWLDEGDGLVAIDVLVPSQVEDGRLAAVLSGRAGARRLVLSVESAQVPAAPSTDPLLTATLDDDAA